MSCGLVLLLYVGVRATRPTIAGVLAGVSVVLGLSLGIARLQPSHSDRSPALAETPAERPRVALQVGHWQHDSMPKELRWVARSAGGTTSAGAIEWRVSLAIARRAARLLAARGLQVEIVPATVRPRYQAAAFVSIHADGNGDSTVSGFKAAPSSNDASGLAATLNQSLVRHYAARTRLLVNPSVTSDMTAYYAFDARRFDHAISPTTPAVIIETGFLTNAQDRRVIVDRPDLAARGIAEGVLGFIRARLALRR